MRRKTVVRKMYDDFIIQGEIKKWDDYLEMEKIQHKNILQEGMRIAYDDAHKTELEGIKWLVERFKQLKKKKEQVNWDDIIFLTELAFK